jgi:hypothetical protein
MVQSALNFLMVEMRSDSFPYAGIRSPLLSECLG